MVRRRPPGTEEGWYALHDLRRVDWDGWRGAPDRARKRAIEEGTEYLRVHEALEDAEEGGSAVFSVVGHDADLLILHLRPTLEYLDRAQRRFESTDLAAYTERADSYVSVTEVSGYMHEDLTDGLEDVEDEGMRSYMQQRIYPEIPDAEHICFYPMDKRRGAEHNWYDLPFEERAEHMSAHGDIGREYAGQVTQIITGSVGLDDHEWGVTLFADDPTDIKSLLYEMRFDPSTSKFAEFGSFHVGRRFPPTDLGALLDGETVPTDGESGAAAAGAPASDRTGEAPDGEDTDDDSGGRPAAGPDHREVDAGAFRQHAGTYGVDVDEAAGYGLLFESDAPDGEVADEVDGLRSNFDHYDTHVGTVVRSDNATTAVVSLWANQRAADTASGFLADLPGVEDGVGADLEGIGDDGGADGEDAGGDVDHEPADGGAGGRPDPGDPSHEAVGTEEFRRLVHRFGVDPTEHDEAGYALVFRSETVAEELVEEVDELRGSFEQYDSHVLTTVRADSGDTAVISLWTSERAADTASGFLAGLSGAGPGMGADFGENDAEGGPDDAADGEAADGGTGTVREQLAELDVYAGQPHGEDVYALVLYSEAGAGTLREELSDFRERFEEYDSHVKSSVYSDEDGDGHRTAVVSIWETQQAADRAAEFLSDLPGIVGRAEETDSGFGTMGMFYTVEPDYREEFVETFGEVGEALSGMEGHLETRLFVNEEDENDMFIASQWHTREDAMEFFRSAEFRDTVEWGREVLADRPRHVFLA
ncbi:heme-dependent peroxidase [Halobacteriales archaeon SW_5_68_122]|nr:MAG: heme-dependent peroxidase [Halobacteriales archaeon SW_5_68_122]